MYLKETLLRVQFALAVLNSTREQQQTLLSFQQSPMQHAYWKELSELGSASY